MNIIFDKNSPNNNNKNVIDTYIKAVENNHLLSNIVLRFMGVLILTFSKIFSSLVRTTSASSKTSQI